jgi:hypothetical protein
LASVLLRVAQEVPIEKIKVVLKIQKVQHRAQQGLFNHTTSGKV